MPLVASLPGNIHINQHYNDHHPPHFHAEQGSDEVLICIADFSVYAGKLRNSHMRDVLDWAKEQQAALALNWVLALAAMPVQWIGPP